MPGINGFETARLIKSRERTKYIPIIFLTAISKDEEYVFEGYSVGAVDYLSKPFQPDILRSKVGVFVDLYHKQRQLSEQQELLRESEVRELELKHKLEITESEARCREIVGSAMDAIIAFDADGRISLFNAAAERMFGLAAHDAVGHDVRKLMPEPLRQESLDRVCRASDTAHSGAQTEPSEHILSLTGARGPSAEEFPIEATASCLDVRGKRTYTLIVRDISERKRTEAALKAQAESLERAMTELKGLNDELADRQAELERAMAARSRFYASMSHELRTPINAILGYSTLLLENIYGPLNEKQAEGITRTHKAAKHLLELVNDVLDLSKIEAGKIELRLQPVYFPALIEDLFVTVRPLADEFGSELTLEHEGEPVKIDQRSAARAADPAQPALERDQVRQGQADSRRLASARRRRHPDRGDGPGRRDRAGGSGEDLRRVRAAREDAAHRGHGARAADLAPPRRDAAGRARGRVGSREGEHVPAQSSRVGGRTGRARAEARGAE